jgi:hypothetical protein
VGIETPHGKKGTQVRLYKLFSKKHTSALAATAWLLATPAAWAEESRVKPLESGFRPFNRAVFGLGVYQEKLQYRTRSRYEPEALGAAFSYDQAIRGPWQGGVLLRWSRWKPKPEALALQQKNKLPELESVAPLSVYTRIAAAPRWAWLWGSEFDTYVRPFAVAGLGYLGFFQDRPTWKRASQEPTDTAATWGAGVRLVWPEGFSLRFSFERWRSLRSFRTSSLLWQCEVQFGDVAGL